MSSAILVIEDDFITQVATKYLLTNAGCTVDVAKNGQDALTFIQNPYQLILMDFGLPDMNGFELTRMIREQEGPNQQVPIIGLTALNDSEYTNRAVSVGMNEVKIKPMTQDIWRSLVSSYFA